jgi:hypothetical protein
MIHPGDAYLNPASSVVVECGVRCISSVPEMSRRELQQHYGSNRVWASVMTPTSMIRTVEIHVSSLLRHREGDDLHARSNRTVSDTHPIQILNGSEYIALPEKPCKAGITAIIV